MFALINKIKDSLFDVLLPKFCVGCGKEGLYICKDCEVFLSEVDPMLGSPTDLFDSTDLFDFVNPTLMLDLRNQTNVVSVWEYEGLMEKLIHKIKFNGHYHIIDELVDKAMEKIELNLPVDTIITYVPMHKTKERKRGFNQAELIAKKISCMRPGLIQTMGLLGKVRDNRSQVCLGPKEREENVRGVFSCMRPGLIQLKNVLLVDDVYTTGATVKECVGVLKKAGAKNVWVFTIARKLAI